MEDALCEFFGHESSWGGLAGTFADNRQVRIALLAVIRRIRTRLKEIITTDDRLLLTTSLELDGIERHARKLSRGGADLLEITAYLLNLVARLLGYDWMSGKPNRQLVYSQTLDQVWIDDRHTNSRPIEHIREEQAKRREFVCTLFEQGLTVPRIARVMLISEPRVKDILVRSGKVTRETNVKRRPT